eukprot:TRINITY_DN1266_c0_g1_i1.p1 TRINITY_DN1266_c0_g1~~TRINITY_DN1266_c0_g1_i1.p1  ORF type:complete len:511 (-),score=149.33 TRINITY_DN1266_c0_g1_i1:1642-3111(-)
MEKPTTEPASLPRTPFLPPPMRRGVPMRSGVSAINTTLSRRFSTASFLGSSISGMKGRAESTTKSFPQSKMDGLLSATSPRPGTAPAPVLKSIDTSSSKDVARENGERDMMWMTLPRTSLSTDVGRECLKSGNEGIVDRLSDLRAKFSELDAGLKSQKMVRQTKSAKMSGLEEQLEELSARLQVLEREQHNIATNVRKLSSMLSVERSSRDALEAMTKRLVDERSAAIRDAQMQEIDVVRTEMERLQQRLAATEEGMHMIGSGLESVQRHANEMDEKGIHRHEQKLVEIEQAIAVERQKRVEEDASIRKEMISKMHSVMNSIEQGRMSWESALESANITQSKQSKEFQDKIEKVRKRLEQSIEDQSQSFAEKMREQAHELEGERRKREASHDEWFSRVESIVSSTRATALEGDSELKSRISQFERSMDDHIWQLKQTIENEAMDRMESMREVSSALESSRQRTEQDIQTLTAIMEDSIRRMHEGIEKEE